MANTFIFDDDDQQPDAGGGPAPDFNGPEQPEEGEGNNRTFLIAAIILGGIVLLSLICMAAYALLILPGQRANLALTSEANIAALTQTAIANQQTQEAALFTETLAPTDTFTPAPTDTPVVVFASETPTAFASSDPATATVEALQTQLAAAQLTSAVQVTTTGTPPPGTPHLARTGFADEVGLPGLFIISIILIAIILLARHLRQVPLSH